MRPAISSVLVLFGTLLIPTRSWAYLDPGSGSMLLQLLLGGVAGLAVAVKLGWRRLLGFFGAKKADRRPEPTDQA